MLDSEPKLKNFLMAGGQQGRDNLTLHLKDIDHKKGRRIREMARGLKRYKKGEGDYAYRLKVWSERAQRADQKRGFKATLHGSRGYWEVKVRVK